MDHRTWQADQHVQLFPKHLQPGSILEDLNQHAQSHTAEHVLGSGFPFLSGFDDLRARHAFRERKTGIHDQSPTEQDDEHHAQAAADQQDDG